MSKQQHHNSSLPALSIAALGVVYGDLGTSPLYALKESLRDISLTSNNILGILSLIFWTLAFVISLKYLIILLRADNDGEGGILALLALTKRAGVHRTALLSIIAIIGAGFIFGDGMLTPAISVISAIEGLNVIMPRVNDWVVPITSIILIAFFAAQHHGTAKIGGIFGPLILLWFIIIALLGIPAIIQQPSVLKAINPFYAFQFFYVMGWEGYAILGGIFLAATGAEALYADLGHFGRGPIRWSWFSIVLPALLLNYFGQGAFLLEHPEGITNPFYLIAPSWATIPLLIIATIATIIASQSITSATFSLVRQAILQGFYPKLPIVQTSHTERGQLYIPQMNFILAIGTLFLVFTFKNANAMAHAYGIAVNLHMILTTCLVLFVALKSWHWHWLWVVMIFSMLGLIDLAFLGANLQKLYTGGWMPITFAIICAFIMHTWQKGQEFIRDHYYMKKEELHKLVRQLSYKSMLHLPGTSAVFISDIYDRSGGTFLNFLKMNRTLPEHIIIVNFFTENIPYVTSNNRFNIHTLSNNICEVSLHYGFMDTISIPQALYNANDRGLLPFPFDVDRATYFIEIPNVIASRQKRSTLFFWQEKLFAFLVRNYSANMDIEFYQLPFNRTVALGTYYSL